MLRTNTVFCCHRNETIARLKEDFGYETSLPLTGPITPKLPQYAHLSHNENIRKPNQLFTQAAAK